MILTTTTLLYKQLDRRWAEVVTVKWSVRSPSTPMIQVQILLTPTDFSVNFVFEKNENKQKRPPGLALFYKNNWQKKNIPKVKINLRAKNDLNKIFRFLLLVEMSGSVGF